MDHKGHACPGPRGCWVCPKTRKGGKKSEGRNKTALGWRGTKARSFRAAYGMSSTWLYSNVTRSNRRFWTEVKELQQTWQKVQEQKGGPVWTKVTAEWEAMRNGWTRDNCWKSDPQECALPLNTGWERNLKKGGGLGMTPRPLAWADIYGWMVVPSVSRRTPEEWVCEGWRRSSVLFWDMVMCKEIWCWQSTCKP